MASTSEESTERLSYAMGLLDASYDWYRTHAIRSKRNYRVAEIALVVVAAAVPTSAAIAPEHVIAPAILGAVVVVLTSLRSVFHWQENYLRYSEAREALEAERRLYNTQAEPYDDAAKRDQRLAAAVTRIEQNEMSGWMKVAAERPRI